jgi:hypothetical protein
LISSILLGIWATLHTIALRNILLLLGKDVAISYWIDWIKAYKVEIKDISKRLEALNWIPFLLFGLVFKWVVIHYLFLSQFPEKQWKELTSTWL